MLKAWMPTTRCIAPESLAIAFTAPALLLTLRSKLTAGRVLLLESIDFLEELELLRAARCLVAGDQGRLVSEAQAWGIPAIVSGQEGLFRVSAAESASPDAPVVSGQFRSLLSLVLKSRCEPAADPREGTPAAAIAEHLRSWLSRAPKNPTTAPVGRSKRGRAKVTKKPSYTPRDATLEQPL